MLAVHKSFKAKVSTMLVKIASEKRHHATPIRRITQHHLLSACKFPKCHRQVAVSTQHFVLLNSHGLWVGAHREAAHALNGRFRAVCIEQLPFMDAKA